MHWARKYIRRQWSPDGEGPARFSCWGLVRTVLRDEFGIQVPALISADGALNASALKQAARQQAFRVVAGPPMPVDVVQMRSIKYLHCGFVLWANNTLSVLHSSHETGVICQPWREAVSGMETELWRRA